MFYLQKLISAFLMPLSIGLILAVIGLFYLFIKRYAKAKFFLIVSTLWIFLFSYSGFSNKLLYGLENRFSKLDNIDKSIKYVMVLGSGHSTDETHPITSWSGETAINRLIEGIRVLNLLESDAKLIVSGYGGRDKNSHAFVQKKLAVTLGVDEKRIITFDKPKTTYEEALSAKEFLKDEKLILVTSASHMYRAVGLFKKAGVNLIVAPTNYKANKSSAIVKKPNSSGLEKSELVFHEYIGYLYAKLRGRID